MYLGNLIFITSKIKHIGVFDSGTMEAMNGRKIQVEKYIYYYYISFLGHDSFL